jgi:hypothetical protein
MAEFTRIKVAFKGYLSGAKIKQEIIFVFDIKT